MSWPYGLAVIGASWPNPTNSLVYFFKKIKNHQNQKQTFQEQLLGSQQPGPRGGRSQNSLVPFRLVKLHLTTHSFERNYFTYKMLMVLSRRVIPYLTCMCRASTSEAQLRTPNYSQATYGLWRKTKTFQTKSWLLSSWTRKPKSNPQILVRVFGDGNIYNESRCQHLPLCHTKPILETPVRWRVTPWWPSTCCPTKI